jgi:hypothetical protein
VAPTAIASIGVIASAMKMVSEARSKALMTEENMVLVLGSFVLQCSVISERITRPDGDNSYARID